ncbi:hypothetical protein BDA96_07G133700 [Sorghum bicolor]|uniref:Uncharacterized protein n=2 Tax=Sorghum bicolor TaxID=4558 RepID=A0A921QMT7_SORBI|nr:hypothetical protein BDA96_07G133700 [Sorghum bicolor]KXG25131.1 hypothetical protein SORBI_3007G124700 [Sorghum bicolor]
MRERPRRRLPSPYGGSTSQRGMNGEAPGPAARKSAEEANPASQAGKGNHGPTTTNSTKIWRWKSLKRWKLNV